MPLIGFTAGPQQNGLLPHLSCQLEDCLRVSRFASARVENSLLGHTEKKEIPMPVNNPANSGLFEKLPSVYTFSEKTIKGLRLNSLGATFGVNP